MGSIHADLSAQHKALPDVFTSQTCVSDKCRLTSGETSSRQSDCKAGLMSSSEPFLAKYSIFIFRKTTEKLGFDHFLFTPWEWHGEQMYQKMQAHERYVHHEYTVPAQWLSEIFHCLFFKAETRSCFSSHFLQSSLLKKGKIVRAPEHMQANTLTPNTRYLSGAWTLELPWERHGHKCHRKEHCFILKMLVLTP